LVIEYWKKIKIKIKIEKHFIIILIVLVILMMLINSLTKNGLIGRVVSCYVWDISAMWKTEIVNVIRWHKDIVWRLLIFFKSVGVCNLFGLKIFLI